jgi:amylosucrase
MIPAVRSAVDEELAGVEPHRREQFDLRLARWWADLRDGLAPIYPDAEELLVTVVRAAAAAYRDRDPELLRLDQARILDPGWFQSPRVIGYAAYAERFASDLAGVRAEMPYLRELGVTYLHLMPLLRPRDGDSDGGYAVADYRSVRPDLGTMDDLRELASALRAAGISLVLDLVLNHVAREHDWAAAARAGSARHRAYFRVFGDRAMPDAYERTLQQVFPDFAPGNFTWDDDLAAWVWTTFNSWQWDVDWSNPQIFAEYADLLLHLANQGVEGRRARRPRPPVVPVRLVHRRLPRLARAASSSRPTRRPATGGSAGRRPAWSAGTWRGCCWPTRSPTAGAACR